MNFILGTFAQHPYGYALGNPLKFVDSNGQAAVPLVPILVGEVILGAVAALDAAYVCARLKPGQSHTTFFWPIPLVGGFGFAIECKVTPDGTIDVQKKVLWPDPKSPTCPVNKL